jgi:nicotinate-nucleotide pyrophosphorylase (carboxylating)
LAEPLGLDLVRRALLEDRAVDDVTTPLLGAAADTAAAGRFVAEGDCVVAGLPVAALVFSELDRGAALRLSLADGDRASAGIVLATVTARAGALLAGERVALNLLQRLSGIATATRRIVDAVAGTGARVTHTRKTTPGLRDLERYAVRVGGGVDNRASLAESVLWKDNHWVLLGSGERNAGSGLKHVLAKAPQGVDIVVEVETDEQLTEALAAGVTHVLADNRSPATIAAWVRRAGPGVTIQASGGITAATAAAYARAGAHLISVGALTHSAPAAPIGFELQG